MKNQNLYEAMFNNKVAFYYTSDDEVALMKKIDIKHLKFVKEIIKKFKLQLTIRYRGNSKPNYARPQSFCHMDFADTFAIYER